MSTDTTDTVKTIALVASPFLVGFVLFLLNRNKEYKVKKSDVCGDIYACLEELKAANSGWVTAHINQIGFTRNWNLSQDGDFTNEERAIVAKIYQDSVDDVEKEVEKKNTVMKNLRKYIGIYRFYLSKEKKSELDKLMEPFTTWWSLNYDFSDINTIDEVTSKLEEIIATYNREQTPIDLQRYKAIIDFIDDQEAVEI